MGSHTTTSNQNQYNPTGLSAYNSLIPQMQSIYGQWSGVSPTATPGFQANQQAANQQANLAGQQGANNLTQNLAAGGFGGMNMPAFAQNQMGQIGRGVSAMKGNAFVQNLQNAVQNQLQAAAGMGSFQPLQTGSTSTQSTGGLGTWLPQLLGAGLGIASGLGGGGALSGLGSLFGMGGSSAGQSLPSSFYSNMGQNQNLGSLGMGSGYGSMLPSQIQAPTITAQAPISSYVPNGL